MHVENFKYCTLKVVDVKMVDLSTFLSGKSKFHISLTYTLVIGDEYLHYRTWVCQAKHSSTSSNTN